MGTDLVCVCVEWVDENLQWGSKWIERSLSVRPSVPSTFLKAWCELSSSSWDWAFSFDRMMRECGGITVNSVIYFQLVESGSRCNWEEWTRRLEERTWAFILRRLVMIDWWWRRCWTDWTAVSWSIFRSGPLSALMLNQKVGLTKFVWSPTT